MARQGEDLLQVAAIICLIAFDLPRIWADLLLYAAVAMTVTSGVDYFLGFRKRIEEHRAKPATRQSPGPASP